MNALAQRGSHCGCPKCLGKQRERMIDRLTRSSLRIAVRHAQEHEHPLGFEARSAGFPPLPQRLPSTSFTLQWSGPYSINAILGKARPGTPVPPASFMHSFNAVGQNLIYAVLRKGTVHPLYVGQVPGRTTSMRARLGRHMRGVGAGTAMSGTGQLNNELRTRGDDVYLALATYTAPGYRINPNMTRVIEGLVQETLRPRYWSPNVTTFEDDAWDDRSESEAEERDHAMLAQLLKGDS